DENRFEGKRVKNRPAKGFGKDDSEAFNFVCQPFTRPNKIFLPSESQRNVTTATKNKALYPDKIRSGRTIPDAWPPSEWRRASTKWEKGRTRLSSRNQWNALSND